MTKEQIRELARGLGIDLTAFTTTDHLNRTVPPALRPAQISEYLPAFLVLAKHIPTGISAAADGEAKIQATALVHRRLEEAAGRLAYALEERDYLAVFIPSLVMDFKERTELSNTPAGQSSLFLRLAAVEAGMGTLGLNNMLLTERFGPRVYLCGMMTNLEVEPDAPLREQLCPGLQRCGRCAGVCPARAIPLEAPAAAALSEYRGLDEEKCAEHAQPYGVRTFVRHLESILQTGDPEAARREVESPLTSRIWLHMSILRQGAFTGCSRCLQVCPVGEDYERLQASPHRQADLPADFRPRADGDLVVIDR